MNYLRTFDRSVASAVGKLPGWVHPVMVAASFIGEPVSAAVILLGVMGATYMQKNMRLLLSEFVILLLLPLASIIKIVVHRDRPATLYVEHMWIKSYSFPSGHAYASFLVFGFLAFLALHYVSDPWKWPLVIALIALIFLVGVSRIYLGAHFPSDVLGGWLLAAIVLFVVIKFVVTL
jgi:undecaprenyl-diphosphatase